MTTPIAAAELEYTGFVERIDDGVAYVSLQSATGETIEAEWPASELATAGVRRRFRLTLEAIPDCVVSEERERAIAEEIDRQLGDQ